MVEANSNPARDLVLQACQDKNKDPTTVLQNMEDEDIGLEDLQTMTVDEFTSLGFTIGVRKRVEALLKARMNNENVPRE